MDQAALRRHLLTLGEHSAIKPTFAFLDALQELVDLELMRKVQNGYRTTPKGAAALAAGGTIPGAPETPILQRLRKRVRVAGDAASPKKPGASATLTGTGPQLEAIIEHLGERFEFVKEPVWTDHPDPEAQALGVKAAAVLIRGEK